ncbi:hypothetical protein D3C79_1045330 [compost metagenome]
MLKRDSETREPWSLYTYGFSAWPLINARMLVKQRDAIWCADWARGGTKPPPSFGQEAQSPMAKMFGSRVVCSVGSTTS